MGAIFSQLGSAKGSATAARNKTSTFIGGWANSTTRLRGIALIVLTICLLYVLITTILSNKKFFPHQPSRHQLRRSELIKDVKEFQKLHFPHNVTTIQ